MTESTVQRTLTGKEANCGRVRPQTLVYCHECGTHILRRHRFDHEVYMSSTWRRWGSDTGAEVDA